MKQYTFKQFKKILYNNGFFYSHNNGDHYIFKNNKGNHVSIPYHLACVIARRLIKENKLKV